MSRVFLTLLSALFALGLLGAFARPALAANCNLAACISTCSKTATHGAMASTGCNSWCAQTIDERKAKGQCKK
jgi:hypothetical protein